MEIETNQFKIFVPKEIVKKIRTMYSYVNSEIGAFMSVGFNKECGAFTINSIHFPSQLVTGSSIDFDDDDVEDALKTVDEIFIDAMMDDRQINGCVHSHVNMSNDFSNIDDEDIENWMMYGMPYWVSICVNKMDKWNGRLDFVSNSDFGSFTITTKVPVELEKDYDQEVIDIINQPGMIRLDRETGKIKRTKSGEVLNDSTQDKFDLQTDEQYQIMVDWMEADLKREGINTARLTGPQIEDKWYNNFYGVN